MLFAVLAISTAQLCLGDQQLSVSPVSPGAQPAEVLISELNQKVGLGQYAQIDLPKGYRFIDVDAARVLLEKWNNPVSPGLVGLLAPEDGKWWAVLEFNEIGYVKDFEENKADSATILQAVQNRNDSAGQGPARVVSVNWQMEPKSDADAHSLEWAFLVEGRSGKVVNHTIALFGRRGVLNITTVQPYKPELADSAPLNELVKKISFKEGQRYADYQTGDKIASGGIKELVMGERPAEEANQIEAAAAPNPAIPGSVMLVYVIVGCCAVSGLGMLVYSQLRKPRVPAASYANGHAVPAMQGNGSNGSNGRHSSGRPKRVFNYQKYYSDMVMQLSGSSYTWTAPANGHSHPRAAAAPEVGAASPVASNQALANANLELIACQNNLIEEQRNLMREQARIIEEKAKLIKEYNQLMEKWSQDIENQFSLKLD